MKIRERVFQFIYIFLACSLIWSETEFSEKKFLEVLWENVKITNSDVLQAEDEIFFAKKNKVEYWKKWLPQISITTSTSFLEGETDYERLPRNYEINATVLEKLPGGASISIGPTVSFSKSLLNFEKEAELNNVKYTDFERLGISYVQPLSLISLKEYHKDLEKHLLELDFEQKEIDRDIVVQSVIEEVTATFVDYRKVLREIDSAKITDKFYNDLLESLYEKKQKNQTSYYEIYKVEISKQENSENLANLLIKSANLEEKLQNLANFSQIFKKNDVENQIFDDFPKLEKIDFPVNYQLKNLRIQKKILDIEWNQEKKNISPMLVLNASMPLHKEDDSDLKVWNISVSLDLSNVFTGKNKTIDNNYSKNFEKLDKIYKKIQKSMETEAEFYRNCLKIAKNQLNEFSAIYDKNKEIYEGLVLQYEKGNCSLQDLLQSKMSVAVKKNQLENHKDEIWYYEWMLKTRNII